MAKTKLELSLDDQLTHHMEQAEEHLIKAINLFAENEKLNRRIGYLPRLMRAQELVTSLHAEELVRVLAVKRPRRRR